MSKNPKKINQPLEGINVFDLTRVLAGPTATQVLGDLGANIIKVERPVSGDDSRNLGPPYLDNSSTKPQESAYYLSVNRNKNSVTIDLTKKKGQLLAKKIIKNCDVLVENFRAGNLKQYGLDFKSIKKRLIIFKQKMYYYKFNLLYEGMVWHGSRACMKKNFISPQWLRDTKHKKYPAWRLDTIFSKYKYS